MNENEMNTLGENEGDLPKARTFVQEFFGITRAACRILPPSGPTLPRPDRAPQVFYENFDRPP